MEVSVTLRLNPVHELILSSLTLGEFDKFDDLIAAVRLVNATQFDYNELLKLTVRGALEGDSLFWLVKPNAPEALSRREIEKEFSFLEQLELVSKEAVEAENSRVSHYRPRINEDGKRIAAAILEERKPLLRPVRAKRTTVFVASAIGHKDVNALLQQEIEPACREFGYVPLRIDLSEPSQTITSAILEGIQNAACVVADLTYARQSVYFEIGLAHGLGIPLVLTCRQDHYRGAKESRKVHFDLEQYKISYWTVGEQGTFSWPESMHPKERFEGIFPARIVSQ